MIDLLLTLSLAIVSIAALALLVRVVTAPSLADRIVALDTLLLTIVAGIAVHAARSGTTVYLNVLVVTALLAFVGTALVARFISRQGDPG